MLYTITANGKSTQIYASSAEIAVRSQMCFHRYNTVFTVTDSNGNTENYRIVRSKQAILGYTDLIKEAI